LLEDAPVEPLPSISGCNGSFVQFSSNLLNKNTLTREGLLRTDSRRSIAPGARFLTCVEHPGSSAESGEKSWPTKKGSAQSFDRGGNRGGATDPTDYEKQKRDSQRISDQKRKLRAFLLVSAHSCCQSQKSCAKQHEARRFRRNNRLLFDWERQDGEMKLRNRKLIIP
jgi:hypothetical protein